MTALRRVPPAPATSKELPELPELPRSILHVSQPGSEGVGNYVARVAQLQAAAGHRVAVACPADTGLAAAVDRSAVEFRPWSAGRQPGHDLPREVARLHAIVDEIDPAVVHLHSSKAGLAGRLAIRGRRPTVFQPHAWSFHALDQPLAAMAIGWERLASRWTDVVVAVSDAELAAGRSLRIRPRSDMRVTPNPVDTDRFTPEPNRPSEREQVRRSLGLSDEPLAVCVGRLCHQKGQDRLVELWPSVLERVPSAHLLLVGDGPSRTDLEARAGDQILFAGNRADVPAILRAAQVVVLPSRWEGMSLAVLEALATARPVVTTDVAGVAETVGRGAGAIVAQDQLATLVDEIAGRLDDPHRAAREGAEGRRIMTSAHRFSMVVDRIGSAYRCALEAHGVRRLRPAGPAGGAVDDG
ncbi:MAG: glycosyltransferase [Actinomycetota bacterium]